MDALGSSRGSRTFREDHPHVRLPPKVSIHWARDSGDAPFRLPLRETHAPQQTACTDYALFDHLVGAGEQGWRHGKAKRLRRLEIDCQPECCRRILLQMLTSVCWPEVRVGTLVRLRQNLRVLQTIR